MQRYNPKDIEPKWQKIWEDSGINKANDVDSKPKKYVLEYFPYPSGAAMHVGHVRNYTIGDAMARHARMTGFNVLHPMGWDAFGLPAENYAIKNKVSPRIAIDDNTAKFKQQLIQMGFSYDWSREIDSTDPNYYRWTQWFFLLLFKKGLAYQKESLQWWCPFDKTVLANEQVEAGVCWRCGNKVEKKLLKQWFFKITDYADRLLDDLNDLDWSDAIKAMQRNWIGRSRGAEIDFIVDEELNYVVLHGFTATSQSGFIPKLKVSIEAAGKKFIAPNMPETDNPTITDQANFVLKNCEFDENTVLLGHSLGTAVALRVLENLEQPIKKLVLAAGFAAPGFLDHERPFEKTSGWNFDFDKIKKNVSEVVILRASNDSAVPPERADELANKLNGTIVDFCAEEDHITGKNEPVILSSLLNQIEVFTTRPDTLFGATFMVVAPEHSVVTSITTREQERVVQDYIASAQAKSDIERQDTDREKTGVFTGAYAINPVNGAKLPIWIADYVLAGYGTGAIMAVPAHDERDHAFATKFELPIIRVVKNDTPDDACSHDEGVMINSGEFDGQSSSDAREAIVSALTERSVGSEKVNFKMRDWLISRQRYWGAPIPIIHCKVHGAVAVPEADLPVVLPEIESYEPSGDGRSPLAKVTSFVNTTCPTCGGPGERETDTMDGFACSSWYFLRFADPGNTDKPFDTAKANDWAPVDDYIGGAEHAVMHLLYARFWTKVIYDEGMINFNEPFTRLRNHGMILAPDGNKMSKSKGNTIEPSTLIDQGYGADTVRVMELFIGPWNQAVNWSIEGVGGAYRFLQRIWTLSQEFIDHSGGAQDVSTLEADILRVTHKTIKKVSEDLATMNFNTALAAQMECVNQLYKLKEQDEFASHDAWVFAIESLLQLVAPFAPHIAEELWHQIGHEESVHLSTWPLYDPEYLVSDTMTVAVQINGKLRGQVSLLANADEATVVSAAKADPKVAAYLNAAEIRKTIYVPSKIVNFVV